MRNISQIKSHWEKNRIAKYFSIFLFIITNLYGLNWTKPVYLEPQFTGNTFAINRDETRIYYANQTQVYWRDKIGPNQWSDPHLLVGEWNNSHLTRNFWIDPDEQVAIWSDYTSNWQLFLSRKDSAGNWSSSRALPSGINSPGIEWWGSISPSGDWLYFSRYISGQSGALLRARYINDSTFADPETLAFGEYRINYGGDEWVGTLSPREDELIFMGYRYWHNDGRGEKDLFSSILNCNGTWRRITRLDCSYDKQFQDIHIQSGDEEFPQLSTDNRTLYFQRFYWIESDSGMVPDGGYCFSKRIWSKVSPICSDSVEIPIPSLDEPTPFQFEVNSPDSVQFIIQNQDGTEIVQHADTVNAAGLWRIRWFGINDTASIIVDGDYRVLILTGNHTDTTRFSISEGQITLWSGLINETYKPKSFNLETFPNPFNMQVQIRFSLPQPSRVTLAIYNLKGSRVNLLVNQKEFNKGKLDFDWNGMDEQGNSVGSGLYFCKMDIVSTSSYKSQSQYKKILLLK